MSLPVYLNKINEKIAMNITLVFGTMWTTYLFFLYGLIPLFFPQYMDKLLYWSNTVQLWSLPLLMVGTNLLGSDSERRNKEMYNMIKSELETSKLQLEELKKLMSGQKKDLELHEEQNELLEQIIDNQETILDEQSNS